jgi:hypothetical protein
MQVQRSRSAANPGPPLVAGVPTAPGPARGRGWAVAGWTGEPW